MFKNKVRWSLATVMFFGGIINYMDRASLSVMAPFIEKDLNLTETQMGIVFSSFFLGYALFCFVGGICADKFGPRKTMAGAMGLWSLFCGLTAMVTGFFSMVVIRVLFGMGEGPLGTTNNKTIKSWFPRKEAAFATGFINSGQPLGGALCGPIVGFLALSLGWRIAFVVIMLLGFIWIFFWLRAARDTPEQHPDVSAQELAYIRSDTSSEVKIDNSVKIKLSYYLKKPTIWFIALGYFSYSYVLSFFITWFPTYLVRAHGLDIKTMGFVNAIPWLFGAIGLLTGGLICDWLYRRSGKALSSSKKVVVTGMLVSACSIIYASNISSIYPAVVLMTLTVYALYNAGTCIWSTVIDTIPAKSIGSVGGFIHLIANLAGIIGPTLTGVILQQSQSFPLTFVIVGSVAVVGALAISFTKPILMPAHS
ncbi:MFS transporter [Zophobihabitans entericus]|uniref:MFS transporter n=1 Tax=Zophobihabitans entericus TaxID=1635327 RepID=A0A6G9IBF1_9GAMM|nr:MFS transporter [Zophobihabitans entericus]QIQ21149.1 MFS transporter [Zophobihabitans entericus]